MLNNVNLIGRLTKDIEIRKTQTNKSVIRFTLAISRGKDKETSFIECQAWEGRAETIAKYVHKGDMLHVQGEMMNSNYEKNGVKIYSYYVLVSGFTLLPNNKTNNEQRADEYEPSIEPAGLTGTGTVDINTDDLPFY